VYYDHVRHLSVKPFDMKLLITGLLLAMAGSNSKHQLHDRLPAVNINYMIRGHFYASSLLVEELAGIEGDGEDQIIISKKLINHFL
jgi:hypothetical protein